jgi:hypothetical protein
MANIRAKINSNTSSGPQQVAVQVPSSGSLTFKGLNDVNVTSLADGALIQYDANTDKFTTRNELETTTGTLRFNGGQF